MRVSSQIPGVNSIAQKLRIISATLFSFCLASGVALAENPEPPRSPDGAVRVSLFAAEPDIVTPIGATVDSRGRLLVVESHSHFRPKNYLGPPTDRIRILEDTTGSDKADRITTLYESTKLSMNLMTDRDGSIVVSSRNEIFRLAMSKDGAAGEKKTLAKLDTKADYPHNGLHGLAIDRDGSVCFGIGENLGGPWTLIGADGKKLSDSIGTGAIFRVDSQGRGLMRIAHGFWNPFGLGFDSMGNLWAVDNDPDGRPPCRLIHVVPGGDFGYQYRYGRTGMHPLQAWDAELPGTLGMVAGVGEGPCAVQWHDGRLYVSSWRDHQVQAYTLTPRGASYTATMQPLVVGGDNFRPVALAFAPDGSLFVTDWASGSYEVNGKGRVWKLTFIQPKAATAELKPTEAMTRAAHLRQSENLDELIAAMNDDDAATAQAAQFGLSRLTKAETIDWASLKSPRQRIGLLAALMERGSRLQTYVAIALKDADDRVRQMAVRAVADQDIKEARPILDEMLASQIMSPRLLGMTVAAITQLDGDKAARIDSGKINKVLLARMNAPQAADQTKAGALRMLLASHPRIGLDQIQTFVNSSSQPLQLEAVRYLNDDSDAGRFALLAKIATDAKVDATIRVEAIIGLTVDAAAKVNSLLQLARDANVSIRQESLRSLRPIVGKFTVPQQEQLANVAQQFPAEAELVQRLMGKAARARPPETDVAAWQKIADQTPGDADAGRRIFFHPSGPGCFRCHMIEGRGRAVGPDLTMIGHSQSRQHVLESILDPSREIAPLFTLWTITTKSGQKIDAMLLRRDGQAMEVYVDSTGLETKIAEKDIVDRKIRKESVMPTGLSQGLTDQELRDLLALLTMKR